MYVLRMVCRTGVKCHWMMSTCIVYLGTYLMYGCMCVQAVSRVNIPGAEHGMQGGTLQTSEKFETLGFSSQMMGSLTS